MHGHDETACPDDGADARMAVEGDGEAYARLVRRHQVTVARQMWRFTRNEREHAELVQDVFVSAYMSLRGYRGSGPFLHWLRKIALRSGLAFWKRRAASARQASLDEQTVARLAEDPAGHSAAEAGEVVHRALALLPPRDRLVLTLMHLEERSVAETAALLDWSPALVKVQAWRARAKLKKALQSLGMEEE